VAATDRTFGTMSTLESLPVELVSDILSETDIPSLINVSCVSRRLRSIVSDPSLNPWRHPILRNLRSGDYDKSLNHLSVRSTVPRQNWIEIMSVARASYLLFDATLPNLKDFEWEECFRRRFLPSWARKKESTWRDIFYKYVGCCLQ
jgi:F-box-like